ncbi:hypothetical protein [Clostridium thermarum]|uniref:hypothetical protein n=1 Tax=Clostridium thermarum TaxID=1716543 RepID=UPI001122F4C8|nr:hypothetical protein [Clostridium thermarum]
MKTYSPGERLKTLDLPNLFDFAGNDLSQDAFLCWALGWINIRGHQMCDFAFLLFENILQGSAYNKQIAPLDIEKVEIKRKYKSLEVLVLAKLKDGRCLPIIFEDKLDTILQDYHIQRYRQALEDGPNKYLEPIWIFYNTGYIFEPYSKIEKHKCIVFDKHKMLKILQAFENCEMPLLFCDYYDHLLKKVTYEEEVLSAYGKAVEASNINILNETLHIDFAQWKLMKRLTTNLDENFVKNLERGHNPNGSPWTIYHIRKYALKGNDQAFYRVDRNKEGYYLSLRQYLKYDSEENMKKTGIKDKDLLFKEKMKRLELYRKRFTKVVGDLKGDLTVYISNRGAYESEIGTFHLNSMSTLLWLEKNLPLITEKFFESLGNRR